MMADTIGKWNPAWGPKPQWQGPARAPQAKKRYRMFLISCPCQPETIKVWGPAGESYVCARCGTDMIVERVTDGRIVSTVSATVGERFGRLIVEMVLPDRGRGRKAWVRCDCGETKAVWVKNLRSGQTRSCGCLFRESRAGHPWRRRAV